MTTDARLDAPLPRAPSWLLEVPLAHRGLHGPGVVENALPAFDAAARAGYGVELDVRLSADGVAVVVHDADLMRVAGRPDLVDGLTAAELAHVRLIDGTLGVPTLAEVLVVMRGLPVMVEIKQHRRLPGALERAVASVVVAHDGPVCIASFHPLSVGWFRRNRPDMVRVLTAWAGPEPPMPAIVSRTVLGPRSLARLAPHAISYDLAGLPNAATDAWRARGGALVTWTVRDDAGLERARRLADNLIFEGVRP